MAVVVAAVCVVADGHHCPFTFPAYTFTIPRSYNGNNESYNWLISLTTPSTATPTGDTPCSKDVYVGQYSGANTSCMAGYPTTTVTGTGCTYYYQNNDGTDGPTYTIVVDCDTNATTLQAPSVMVATKATFGTIANLRYTGTFKSAAVCGAASPITAAPVNEVTFLVQSNQIFYPVFNLRQVIANAINVAPKTITIIADNAYGERTLVLSFSSSADASAAIAVVNSGSLKSDGINGIDNPSSSDPTPGNGNAIIIGAAVGGGAFVLIVVGIIAFCVYKSRTKAPVKCGQQEEVMPQVYNFGQPTNPAPPQQQNNNFAHTSSPQQASEFGQPVPAWQQNFIASPQQPSSYGNNSAY